MAVYLDKKTKKWYYEFNYKTATGETKRRKKRGFNLKSDAKKAEALEQIKLKEAPPSSMNIRQLYEMYAESKSPEWLPNTERRVRGNIEHHVLPYFGDIQIDKISTKEIEEWKLKMYSLRLEDGSTYKESTLKKIRRDFSSLFNYAIRHRFLSFNPITAVSGFKDPMKNDDATEKVVWSPEEFNRFIGAVDEHDWKIFFTFLWVSGVRIGEAQGVMFKDIDFKEKTVKISKSIDTKQKGKPYVINPTKTKKMRIIELPESFMQMLRPYYEYGKKIDGWNKERFLFGFDKPLPNSTIDYQRNRYISAAGVKYISSHCFRHSHATLLLSSGIDIKSVSERLGHKDVEETLNTYAHVLPRNKSRILSLLDETIIK